MLHATGGVGSISYFIGELLGHISHKGQDNPEGEHQGWCDVASTRFGAILSLLSQIQCI